MTMANKSEIREMLSIAQSLDTEVFQLMLVKLAWIKARAHSLDLPDIEIAAQDGRVIALIVMLREELSRC